MNLNEVKIVYFLGIGGIGMSAIAHFFLRNKCQVFGYDHVSSRITETLTAEGAKIHFDENVDAIPENVDLVIFTPAIPKKHSEYQYFIENKVPLYKRSQVLGMICSNFPTIAVAGTHGKTTTTALITHLLHPENQIISFIGGIANNFKNNFVVDSNPNTAVVEADEFDRSFLTLFPNIAVITSIDADHLDIYGDSSELLRTFQLFANQVDSRGALIIHENIADKISHPKKVVYGVSDSADYQAKNVQLFHNKAIFDLYYHGELIYEELILGISGMHNVLNAVAALVAVFERISLNTKTEKIDCNFSNVISKMPNFKGVARRFDIRVERDDFIYIDDYAHHPEEIKSFLTAIKRIFPHKKAVGIFQPHLYSRTRDFAYEFAEALSLLDFLILLEIYPAREDPIPGVTSSFLLDLVPGNNKVLLAKEDLLPFLLKMKPELLLTIGAGDIDRFVPQIESLF